MKTPSTPSSPLIALLAVTFFAACGDGTTEPPPDPPRATTVTVSPATAGLAAVGATVQLSAEVRDQNGQAMAEATVTWASSTAAVAMVDASGLVTAVANGTTTVTATSSSVFGSAIVTVAQKVSAVAMVPDAATVVEGDTLRLAATATDANGQVLNGVEFAWASGDTAVAVVDAAGLVTGVGAGQTEVTATSVGVVGTAALKVVAPEDREALEALYKVTDGPNWVNNEGWLTDAPLGEWHGVSTDGTGRVLSLDLGGNNLSGPIPAELGHLTSLMLLHLGSNNLSGPIPPELGNLSSLTRLDLYYNDLTGAIPPELGDLLSLTWLRLGLNGLAGPVPPELGKLTSLTTLRLGPNDLTGPIPSELAGLVNLTGLSLDSNDLTGPIPPELGNLASLTRLDLAQNDLTGSIPPELGNLANLEYLSLHANDLTGAISPELGKLANLRHLHLSLNDLRGSIPPELGNLSSLTYLVLYENGLTGPVPPGLADLVAQGLLTYLDLSGNDGLCVPGIQRFASFETIEVKLFSWCNEADISALEALYEAAGGSRWRNDDGWMGNTLSLGTWYGVRTDSLGRVTTLDLSRNGLDGRLPGSLGELVHMTELRIPDNPVLRGRLPLRLVRLSLRALHYSGTDLCAPVSPRFNNWLGTIASHDGTGTDCLPSDRGVLEALYDATEGPSWIIDDNWLTDAPLGEWFGVEADSRGRVIGLDFRENGLKGLIPPELGDLASLEYLSLYENGLRGSIPPELGNLTNLTWLVLGAPPAVFQNDLTGPIPPELGNLANLTWLDLAENDLTGSIPPELGGLASLEYLSLHDNDLAGAIPSELGNLVHLTSLSLGSNNFTGLIPSELGNLTSLTHLALGGNDLAGGIPRELGNLTNLIELGLAGNAGLAGVLPGTLTRLNYLRAFFAGGTGLCAPNDPFFLDWLDRVQMRYVAKCSVAAAYLTQAVQSRRFPVPLVAGEEALLRVFVTAANPQGATMPPVRARLYHDGSEAYVAEIAATSHPIPKEVDEGRLEASANAAVPGDVVRPGLELVVEVDPEETLNPSLDVVKRIPAEGYLALNVRRMPTFNLTVIPFLSEHDPDSSLIGVVAEMAADAQNHELLQQTADLLPVADMRVTAHAPVVTSSQKSIQLLRETEAIRVIEGGIGHYMGMFPRFSDWASGRANLGGWTSVAAPRSGVIAHELGHNLNLGHAPCDASDYVDPNFPDRGGRIGAWGYAVRTGSASSGRSFAKGELVPPTVPDLMSYCGDPKWIGDYHFTRALRHRLADEGAAAAALTAGAPGPVRSLLLWGGVDTTRTPFLNPAFVVNAPPALPDSTGDYAVTGRDANGRELFSLSFAMPVALSEDGEVSSFVFALPARSGWADALASVTLSGPAGTATLDGDSDMPMAILRDPVTGRVRGFLRGADDPAAIQPAADAPAGGRAGMNVLFSRGIPSGTAWRN